MLTPISIQRFENGTPTTFREDVVATEEPLEIRVEGEPLVVAMRTPGQDEELAAGWLVSEGIVRSHSEIAEIVVHPASGGTSAAMVDVMLTDGAGFDAAAHKRAATSNSSCGLCGAASIAQVLRDFPKIENSFLINANVLAGLPGKLAENQPTFQRTGGIHACGLFDKDGALLAVREDVGRHNALDKLIGWALLSERTPLSDAVLLLSGRVSYEMIQKALAAGIPLVAAIGAPSSLAVDLARQSGITLVAFLRGQSFNVYSGEKKICGTGAI